jgi:hypothetical protein
MTIKVGTWVTYDDEDPAHPEIVGEVVEPTDEEIDYGATYEYPRGPEHGHVVVKWDDDILSRSWEEVEDLQIIAPPVVDRIREGGI